MNAFSPSITHSPPSSRAVVRVPPASLPASGSVRPKAPSARPAHRSGSHSWRWSSVPNRKMGLAPRPTPASSVMARDWSTRASSSMAMHSVVRSAPPPPYSSGKGMPNSPRSPMWRTTSVGKACSASQRSAWGAISLSAKSRTTLRSASCSSVNSVCTRGWYGERPGLSLPPVQAPGRRRGPVADRPGGRDVGPGRPGVGGDLGRGAAVRRAAGAGPLRRVRPARPWPGTPWHGARSTPGRRRSTATGSRRGQRHPRRHRRRRRLPGQPHPPALGCRCPPGPTSRRWGRPLAEGNPAPYAAVVRLPSVGCQWPRRRPSGSCGGTATGWRRRRSRARPPTPADLPKDRAENVMIVDLVRNDLGRVCEVGLGGGARAVRGRAPPGPGAPGVAR